MVSRGNTTHDGSVDTKLLRLRRKQLMSYQRLFVQSTYRELNSTRRRTSFLYCWCSWRCGWTRLIDGGWARVVFLTNIVPVRAVIWWSSTSVTCLCISIGGLSISGLLMSQDRTDLFDVLCSSASSALVANLFWASLVISSCSVTSACSFTNSLSFLV